MNYQKKVREVQLFLFIFAVTVSASDWPHWRGPHRNGTVVDKERYPAISGTDVEILWTKTIGKGFAAVSIQENRAYTLGKIDEKEIIYCLEAESGEELWRKVYPAMNYEYQGP